MNKSLLTLIVLSCCSCTMQTEPTPTCVVSEAYIQMFVNEPPRRVVMCQCMPGAVIPDECGGGIAP